MKERCVVLEKNSLAWSLQPCPTSFLPLFPTGAKGQTELNFQAVQWLKDTAQALKRGFILLLDYGWTDEEYFQVERPRGTVRGYRAHRLVENLLANPGEQDITAHVRWTPLIAEGKKLGLLLNDFIQQGRWLTKIVVRNQLQLNPQEIRQFHTLTHPEIMGESFRALVLSKEI